MGLSRRKNNWNDGMDCSRDGSEDIGRWEFWGRSSDVGHRCSDFIHNLLSGLSRHKNNWNDGMDCSRDGSEDIGRWEFWDRSNDVVVVAAFYNLLLLVGKMAVFPIIICS